MRIFKWGKEVICLIMGVIALATTLFIIWDVVKWSVEWLGFEK